MPVALDINILPYARYAGLEYPQGNPSLMGLHVAEPRRGAARGRTYDRLILYLVITGNAPLAPAKQAQLLENLAKLYFSTSGTATSAMRAVAEQVNELLLQRNLRLSSSGRQGIGNLVQVVMRDNQVFLANSGSGHVFIITADAIRYFFDAELEATLLGQGRLTPLTFHQVSLSANDTLILAQQPSPDWDAKAFQGLFGQGPESIRRRLFAPVEGDLNALLIQARPGKGKFFILSPKAMPSEEEPSRVVSPTDDQVAEESASPLPGVEKEEMETHPADVVAVEGDLYHPADIDQSSPAAEELITEIHPAGLPADHPEVTVRTSEGLGTRRTTRRKSGSGSLWKGLVAIGTPVARLLQSLGKFTRTLLTRVLPVDPFQAIPNSVMLFIAFVVPVVIATLAGTVYFELGRNAQYEILFSRAQQMAAQAASQADLLDQRAGWEATLGLLDQVEARKSTIESQAMRAQVRNALDELDLVRRLEFLPALGGLPASVNITHLVTSDVDLYMLDSTSGSVFHARLTSHGFELDPSFACGPDVAGVIQSGPVIDIVAWPAGFTPAGSLLAMDAGGNVLYCQPDKSPEVEKMAAPPNALMEDLRGFSLDGSNLYVLDPFSNAVWVYVNSNLDQQPSLYFDQEIPFMSDVIDLAANNRELYLLHSDGRITFCVPGTVEVAPARCTEQPYIDSRLGRENTPLILSFPFSQVRVTEPPDPSLYLLESQSQAVYHFSLRNLVFQRQFLPYDLQISRSVTAFAINSIRRFVFLAFGNQVYYSLLP